MSKKPRKGRDPIDTGTTELGLRHRTKPERRASGSVHIRVLDANEIDKLLYRDDLTPEEHSALVGFQLDLHRANLLGPRASTWDARVSSSGFDITGTEAIFRLKANRCVEHVSKRAGPVVLRDILGLCLEDRPVADVPGLKSGCRALQEFRELWKPPETSD